MSTPSTEIVTTSLQQALVDLIDLSLQAKQAHRHVYGPQVRSGHLQPDDVAERLVAVGGLPDGRASAVVASSTVETYEAGAVAADKVIAQFEERLSAAATRIRDELPELESDLPSQDLLTGIAYQLEKQAWMFRASR